jgi:hypothetical protein
MKRSHIIRKVGTTGNMILQIETGDLCLDCKHSQMAAEFFLNSGMDASHPEFYLSYTAIMPAAPQLTVEEVGIEPGTVA